MGQLRKNILFYVAPLLVLLFFGCHPKVPSPEMEFPEMHIEVDPTGEIPSRFWDAYSLFNKANHLFDDGRFEKAKNLYLKVANNYPTLDFAPLSLFNIGLCHEELINYPVALSSYDRLLREYPKSYEKIKLRFRYAYCHEKLKQWEKAVIYLLQIVNDPKVNPAEQIQAKARIAMATFHSGDEIRAKAMLREAMEKYEELRNRRITVDSYFFAKTCFTLGEFYFNRFREVRIKGEEKEMEVLLESKATMFTLARAQYIKAIKIHEPEIVFSSLFRIGQGYEIFYFSLISAPTPKELESDQKEEYLDKLKVRIAPVLRKSKSAYRRNIKLGADLRMDSLWLDRSKRRLEYLQKWESKNR